MINTHFGIFSTEKDFMSEVKEFILKTTATLTNEQIDSASMYMARLAKGEKPPVDLTSIRSLKDNLFRSIISKGIN